MTNDSKDKTKSRCAPSVHEQTETKFYGGAIVSSSYGNNVFMQIH
jgi:hypothetical protein